VTTSTSLNGSGPGAGPGLFQPVAILEDGSEQPGCITNVRRLAGTERKPGTVLLVVASGLLLLLAAAQGYVSWRAQFMFVNKAKNAPLAAGLEALGLDVAAVIFALLGLAHARMGKPARVERILNVACALGSMVMNLLAANLGSPRSVAVYVLPPILYAACSDRLIAVAGSLGGVRETGAWRTVAAAAPYMLRLVLAPPSTALGLRRWVLAATPLPAAHDSTAPAAIEAAPPASVTASTTASAVTAPADTVPPLPSLRTLQKELRCGQGRAREVQALLRRQRGGAR
jgi:hypothetical protein